MVQNRLNGADWPLVGLGVGQSLSQYELQQKRGLTTFGLDHLGTAPQRQQTRVTFRNPDDKSFYTRLPENPLKRSPGSFPSEYWLIISLPTTITFRGQDRHTRTRTTTIGRANDSDGSSHAWYSSTHVLTAEGLASSKRPEKASAETGSLSPKWTYARSASATCTHTAHAAETARHKAHEWTEKMERMDAGGGGIR